MRKKLLYLALSATHLALSVPVEAQQPTKIPRIGWLTAAPHSAMAPCAEAFRQGLRELGYVEGKNIVVEWRSPEGKPDLMPTLVAELVRLKVDVIVTAGEAVTRRVKEATSTIPIVMAQNSDPVGNGFVASLARPGREHYWIGNPSPGAERKTTGASNGDRSKALTRGPLGEFRECGLFASVKRDRDRRRATRCEASIPQHPESQGF